MAWLPITCPTLYTHQMGRHGCAQPPPATHQSEDRRGRMDQSEAEGVPQPLTRGWPACWRRRRLTGVRRLGPELAGEFFRWIPTQEKITKFGICVVLCFNCPRLLELWRGNISQRLRISFYLTHDDFWEQDIVVKVLQTLQMCSLVEEAGSHRRPLRESYCSVP